MKLPHRVLPGLLAGSMLLGSGSGVFAAQSHAARLHRVLAYGQVSNLQGSAFTVTFTPKKAGVAPKIFQVATTTATREVAAKGTTGALANGEYAIVIGLKTTTGLAARAIRYSVTPFRARQVQLARLHLRLAALTAVRARTVRGTVSATQPTTGLLVVSVTTKKGIITRNFTITPATKYFVGKTSSAAAPAFSTGEKVAVSFKRNKATKALDAIVIRVRATA